MSAPRILLLGAGGHAVSCIDVIEQQNRFAIYGLIGTPEEIGRDVMGYQVIAGDEALESFLSECPAALVTVGQILSPAIRVELFTRAGELGFQLPAIVSPKAYVSRHAELGPGTIIMHGAVVNAGASIGQNCIINSRALVEHDAKVEANCHIATGAIVNGSSCIGEGSFVGSGSVVREGLVLWERCIIGMGLTVRKGLPPHSRVVKD
jgi:sugar O-acyltransferase (sialic acid O-acetyltransferase NeuD family)